MGKDWDNPDTFPLRDRGKRPAFNGRKEVPHTHGFAGGIHIDSSTKARSAFISFMTEVFTEALRVLKPGGHAFVWALPRTSHWTATALEDAGFEIRDVVTHLFGSGFPKSHNLGNGQGTALKPANEHWILCRKPLSEKSIEANVTRWGTGGLNIDASRIACTDKTKFPAGTNKGFKNAYAQDAYTQSWKNTEDSNPQGRWPANLLLSHTLLCQPNGVKRVQANRWGKDKPSTSTPEGALYYNGITIEGARSYSDSEGMETVEDWQCVPECPIAILDSQGGLRKRGEKKPEHHDGRNGLFGLPSGHAHPSEEGYVSRYFQQFSPEPDFVPFGSTGLHCVLCGLLCDSKNDIMTSTKQQEDIISCNTIVSTVGKSSRLGVQPQNIALRNAQEKLQPASEDKSQRRSIRANNAESNGWNTQATNEHTAHTDVWGLPIEQIARLVKCAASLCDSCVTAIAQNLVSLKHKTDLHLLHGLDYMDEISAFILYRNLAQYVESLEKSDTIPTIANLTRLFGSVDHAIRQSTIQARNDTLDGLDQIVPYRYVSKASRTERNRGCEGLPEHPLRPAGERPYGSHDIFNTPGNGRNTDNKPIANNHPTVKSLNLMRWLIRLITPPNGTVLDCFAGSGSTLVAAIQEGYHFIGIEQDESYTRIIEARLSHAYGEVQ